MASQTSESKNTGNYALGGFLILATLLWVFGDPLTALVGTLLIGGGFATYYSPRHF